MTLTEAIITAAIGAAAAILTSIATTFLQGWKWKTGEQPKSAVDAANVMTDTSARMVMSIRTEMENDRQAARDEIDVLRTEVKAARDETAIARAETAAVRDENKLLRSKLEELEDVRDWAERLTHQVISLGGTPVKMRGRSAL